MKSKGRRGGFQATKWIDGVVGICHVYIQERCTVREMSHLILSNTMTTTTMTWKAGRLVCRAPRLLRFGGCRCSAEGPWKASPRRSWPRPSSCRCPPRMLGLKVFNVTRFWNSSEVDIGHLEFDERELIIYIILYSKKNVEDFKFGIRRKPCRSKKEADFEWKWMSHYIGTREICWSCPGWKRVLGHVVCHSQLAPQQLQRSLGEGRISTVSIFEFMSRV